MPAYLEDVARYNAPYIISEVSTRNTSTQFDQVLPFDFDGDADATNNFLHISCNGCAWDTRPTVYFSITETGGPGEGYYFIGYYFFHAYDSGFDIDFFGTDPGHENDLEGVFLVVSKNPLYGPYGVPLMALTESHGNLLPFGNSINGDTVLNHALATGDIHAWAGRMQFWMNPASGRQLPVVALRSDTHAAYMAQDCSSGNSWDEYYDGFGMWGPKPDPNSYIACYHSDSNWLLLEPAMGYPDAWVTPMPANTHNGVWDYRLVELAQSPLWQHRNDSPNGYPTAGTT